ncbi:hypothetical protein GCM10011608_10100 [Micromonospora sonchi]|uniref:Uncharacterized protein n=2 Tax=Micromonospora sonchi TaxID=1763543 RepID=A0A917TL82_9ACTN|nr:hypothetical protein GCM10011608_10100 [Micromonospora sonchi]
MTCPIDLADTATIRGMLADDTLAAIQKLIDHEISQERAPEVVPPPAHATLVAIMGTQRDVREEYMRTHLDDFGLSEFAERAVEQMVREGAAAYSAETPDR